MHAARSTLPLRLPHAAAALLVCLAAPALFVLEQLWLGALLAAAGLIWAGLLGKGAAARGSALAAPDSAFAAPGAQAGGDSGSGSQPAAPRAPSLLRDLSLIVIGLAVVRTIPLAAQLDNCAMVRFTLALGGAVLVPYLVSRYLYRDRATGFPWRGGGRWGRLHWGWLGAVIVLAWLLLPWYFMGSGVYRNWPAVDSPELIGRLFVGVGAVGIWDELFFICTVFAVLLRHFPMWTANVLQMIVFVSFLWELGYRSWGPALTIPFALVQGYIFMRTRSLAYVVTVHLLFDAIVFAVIVHAHNPALFDWFPLAG
ncbi:membrane protease YdiL (CAAX protease family) [Leucobacter exalbidus]|uniref:Membrane protease YdiL (CAAX protease family) n=1 Tax=Leucobacter exalbidus TaxID=662960 RepID=A0A940PUW6_9MICO|nr:CPBP family intramembrane glutamic endopeptidase [Leucobacter exalbidus]MBP1325686.1 membrane protease YdiL (CAAX protease family) [Leucobacter exalbidus]